MASTWTVFVYSEQPIKDGEMGFVGALIGAAPGIFGSIMGLFGGAGKASGLPYGLEGITAYGNQVMQQLQNIDAMLPQLPPEQLGQAVQQAQALAASLSTHVYQAKKGKDAAALNNFKQQAAALVSQISARAQQLAAERQQQSSLGGSLGGIPILYLVLGIAGLGGLYFLMRR